MWSLYRHGVQIRPSDQEHQVFNSLSLSPFIIFILFLNLSDPTFQIYYNLRKIGTLLKSLYFYVLICFCYANLKKLVLMLVSSLASHSSVNACLLPVCQLHGAAVTTVEGIGSTKTKLHPVQVTDSH